jgi:hypothetical protein
MKMSNFRKRSIDPWSPEKDSNELPNWVHEDYETPFHLMADLLINWPGSTPTSELPSETRHLRLVEVVAGYPEVSVGRRPLDFPFFKRSSDALQLSLFLDEIKCDRNSEWHSLRTYLLHWDLVEHSQPQQLSRKKQVQFLHYLIDTIRTGSYHHKKKYSPDKFESGEVKFLTALHSMQITRRDTFWPAIDEGNDIQFKKELEDKKPLRINTNAKKHNYVEHEFKLDKIQTKIREWADDNGWLTENTRHNLRVGYSTVLESLFAKIRSQILKEKRPGSICVDGGGRITYLSHKSEDEENKWVHEKLLNSMLFGQVHPHPYAYVITNEIERYGKCTRENISTLLYKEYISSDSFWKLNQGGGRNAKSGLYKELLGQEKIGHFYPKLVVGHDKDGNPITMPNKTEKPWEMEQCYFCSKPKPEDEAPMSTPMKMIKLDRFVCQFHFLIYEIGKKAILRQSSQEFKPASLNEIGKISDIIIFDGNAIGKLFTPAQQSRKIPDHSDAAMNEFLKEISGEELENLHNLRVEWPEWMHPAENGNAGDENLTDEDIVKMKKQKSQINDILHGLRYPNIIQKQRKSFNFNAMWWTSLRESITENGVLTPWIAAGDDIVLVNQSNGIQSVVRDGLEHIHRNLSKRFPKSSPITFAGGWAQRKDGTIYAAYEKAHHLEQRASHCWKGHIKREFPKNVKDFIGEIKNHEFEQKEGSEYDSKVDFDSASEHKLVFTTELEEDHMSDVDRIGFPSIIISEDI